MNIIYPHSVRCWWCFAPFLLMRLWSICCGFSKPKMKNDYRTVCVPVAFLYESNLILLCFEILLLFANVYAHRMCVGVLIFIQRACSSFTTSRCFLNILWTHTHNTIHMRCTRFQKQIARVLFAISKIKPTKPKLCAHHFILSACLPAASGSQSLGIERFLTAQAILTRHTTNWF